MAAFAFAILDIIASSLSSMQHRVSVECLCPVVVITLKGGTVPEAVDFQDEYQKHVSTAESLIAGRACLFMRVQPGCCECIFLDFQCTRLLFTLLETETSLLCGLPIIDIHFISRCSVVSEFLSMCYSPCLQCSFLYLLGVFWVIISLSLLIVCSSSYICLNLLFPIVLQFC